MSLVRWGGSEYLWYGTAKELLKRGFAVYARTSPWRPPPDEILELAGAGARVSFDASTLSFPLRLVRRLYPAWMDDRQRRRAERWVKSIKTPNVVVSCGSLRDDFSRLVYLADSGIPYGVIVHTAAPEIWPFDQAIRDIERVLTEARRVFFVSEYGREDAKQCIGQSLPNSELVRNPINMLDGCAMREAATFPDLNDGLRVACAARLLVEQKGQDLLLRTMALPKWRARRITLTLYGEGPQSNVLQNVARYLELTNVAFSGHVSDIRDIWSKHHLGILPSRYEGMPLSLIEAMTFARANIVTRVGGVEEIITDNETGFVAPAPTVEALDEALERAWRRRDELKAIGMRAAERIHSVFPSNPCRTFADRLLEIF